MQSQTFIDYDKKTDQVIDQRAKDGHSVEVNGNGRFCGHRFILKTKLFGDKRCIYCGKWFHWKDSDMLTWMRMNNLDNLLVKDRVMEPLHCGSDHCQEYHHLWHLELARRKQIVRDGEILRLFKDLKTRKMIK
jgi:hypothetical protein